MFKLHHHGDLVNTSNLTIFCLYDDVSPYSLHKLLKIGYASVNCRATDRWRFHCAMVNCAKDQIDQWKHSMQKDSCSEKEVKLITIYWNE